MCDDDAAEKPLILDGSRLTRRGFLQGTAAVAAGAAVAACQGQAPRQPLRSPHRPESRDGMRAYSMAMHVHSSFSEQDGSMASQLLQASTNGVDVLWWTDHDHRMDGLGFRNTVHFTSLDHENGGPGQGKSWKWVKQKSGPLASQSGGIVATPASPNDPMPHGSLHVAARSTSTQMATFGYYANGSKSQLNYRDNLTGQKLAIDVLLEGSWHAGYLELLIITSYHQASGGRPAGDYSLSYRFVPPGTKPSRVAQGVQGVITIPVQPSGGNPWYTATLSPADDIAALWPDMDHRDFALWKLNLSAVSTGDQVGGYFDYLRFTRTMTGSAALSQQRDMGSRLARAYPSVAQQQGLEVSWRLPHINWFGPLTFPSYGELTSKDYLSYLGGLIPQIHKRGGLVSYNHPFGTGVSNVLPQPHQDAALAAVARDLLPGGTHAAALGCDMIEIGYTLRGGVDLAHHLALWDIMSRNGIFLTGNGANDDHMGQDWRGDPNNWATSVWANSTSQADLLAALAAGRAWCGSLSSYPVSMDLTADGNCPMGSASVSGVSKRRLTASATGIPTGGSLQVLQGTVDYAGTHGLTANTRVIGHYTASTLSGSTVSTTVDTSKDSFVRTQVIDNIGTVVGLSNPVWLLRGRPRSGIPHQRAA